MVSIGTYVNGGTKLVKEDKDIVIQVGTDTNTATLTYNMIWGAIQAGETENNTRDIYVWDTGGLYLERTITDNIGDDFGCDIMLDDYLADEYPTKPLNFEIMDGASVIRTYNINYMDYCPNGVQLRWISPESEYDYYYFKIANSYDNIKESQIVKQNVWSFDDDGYAPGEYTIPSDKLMANKKADAILELGVASADYKQQLYLLKLQRSIKQWIKSSGGDWVEVIAEVDPIIIDRFRSNQEINVKITKPSLYLQSI